MVCIFPYSHICPYWKHHFASLFYSLIFLFFSQEYGSFFIKYKADSLMGGTPLWPLKVQKLLHNRCGKMNKEKKMLHVYVKINELQMVVSRDQPCRLEGVWEEMSYHLIVFSSFIEVLFINKIIRYLKCTL